MLLTFGEITPKILANSFSTKLARTALRFIIVFYYLFWPLNVTYAWLVRSGMNVVGRDPDLEQQVTADDIEFMVNLSTKEGGLDETQERLLTSVFEYTDTTVKEVMVPRVDMIAVPDDINYTDLMEILVSAGHSRIPVYHETLDDILGMFYAKDLLQFFHKGGDPSKFNLNNYLREPVFVPTTKKVDKLLSELRERRIHIAVAVDEFGGTAGVVTLEDIIEEFFGEIQDEFDQETPLITQIEKDTYLVDARIPLDELSDEMDLDFPEDEDYESLGGFITEKCGRVPKISTALTFGGFLFTVTESEPTHIVSVHIERSSSNEKEKQPTSSITPQDVSETSS
jgi:CBS domain containing-hemolysin-like protein